MYMMYIFCVIIAILVTKAGESQGTGTEEALTLEREHESWVWPNEEEGKNNNFYMDRTTEKVNDQDNPCTRISETEKPNFKNPGRRISEAKCLEYVFDVKKREEADKRAAECLKYRLEHPGKNQVSFAIGGRNTEPGEFPHMGALGWRAAQGTWIFKCGSSLISSKFMLTAAHCSRSPPDTNLESQFPEIVRLGDKNIIDTFSNGLRPVDMNISRIINHPLFSSPKKYYDIAIIELSGKVVFNRYIIPACLWSGPVTSEIGKATLTGWGVVETANRRTSPELQAAVVDVLDSRLCDNLLKEYCNRLWCGMQPHQICAGKLTGGVDACQGDSGGPLQVKIPLPASISQSMHYVIGVTSFGIGCARENLPGIYTSVSFFLDWIESIVWPDNM